MDVCTDKNKLVIITERKTFYKTILRLALNV